MNKKSTRHVCRMLYGMLLVFALVLLFGGALAAPAVDPASMAPGRQPAGRAGCPGLSAQPTAPLPV